MKNNKQIHISTAGLIIISFILFVVLFLFSPVLSDQDEFCGTYISKNNYMGFMVNCDSTTYLEPAEKLSIIFEKNSVRQSRPIYISMGAIFGSLIKILVKFHDMNPYYLAFIMINLILIIISINLYANILSSINIKNHLIYISSIYLICNDIVRFYFWGATPQLFGILTPIATICIGMKIIEDQIISKKNLSLYSLSCGFLPLLYGNFIIVGFVILMSYYYNLVLARRISVRAVLENGVMALVLFILPTLAWVTCLTLVSGGYFNAEIQIFREIVWILDALDSGDLGARFLENTNMYFRTFLNVDILPFFLMSFLVSLYLVVNFKEFKEYSLDKKHIYFLIMSVIAFLFLFFWILGYYAPRFTFTMVPPLVIYITISFDFIIKRFKCFNSVIFVSVFSIITVLWCCCHMFNSIPYIGPY